MNYRNFILDDRRRFIFAYVPKVACTNWKSVMRYLAGHEDWLDNRLAHDKQRGGLHYLEVEGADRDLVADPRVPKYAFVRNPYSRLLSAYLNKVEARLPGSGRKAPPDHFDMIVATIESFRQTGMDPKAHPQITFEVFLTWLRDGKTHLRQDEHWAPQVALLRWPGVAFDMLGRFETLSREAPVMLARMGCDLTFPTQAQVKFQPQHAERQLEAYLTPACRSLIDTLYAADFEAFGYVKGAV